MSALTFALAGFALLIGTTATWFNKAKQVAIPANRSVFKVLWAIAAVLGLASATQADAGWLSGIFGGLSAFGGIALLVLMALGGQQTEQAIEVGQTIPQFSAPDDQGGSFSSAELSGSPVLLKFFRGHW